MRIISAYLVICICEIQREVVTIVVSVQAAIMDNLKTSNADDAKGIRSTILFHHVNDDDGTESDGDYLETRESDSQCAEDDRSDDHCCTHKEAIDNCCM